MGIEVMTHGYLANLELKSELLERIKKSQKGHKSIEGIKKRMEQEEVPGFKVDSEGVLWFNGRLCVPNIANLKQVILKVSWWGHGRSYGVAHVGGQ